MLEFEIGWRLLGLLVFVALVIATMRRERNAAMLDAAHNLAKIDETRADVEQMVRRPGSRFGGDLDA